MPGLQAEPLYHDITHPEAEEFGHCRVPVETDINKMVVLANAGQLLIKGCELGMLAHASELIKEMPGYNRQVGDNFNLNTELPTRRQGDVYVLDGNGDDLGQLDVWEVDPNGRRVFIEEKDGTGLFRDNPLTGKPFKDPVAKTKKWCDKNILNAGRKKATALRDGVSVRVDDGSDAPSIEEIMKAKHIRFEVQSADPLLQEEALRNIELLRKEFPQFIFEIIFGVK